MSITEKVDEAAGLLAAHRNAWFDFDKEQLEEAKKIIRENTKDATWLQNDEGNWYLHLVYENRS